MKLVFGSSLNRVFILFTGLIALGVTGYTVIEGWSLSDALYMTIITISTVGFSEVAPLSDRGQFFSILLIFFGRRQRRVRL